MGFPHGFNTRILQIAAIDERIELCEQELWWLGAAKVQALTEEENVSLSHCIMLVRFNKSKTNGTFNNNAVNDYEKYKRLVDVYKNKTADHRFQEIYAMARDLVDTELRRK
jgi:hypothetical protein